MARSARNGGSILIAHEDAGLRASLSELFRQAGYETREAMRGDEAVEAARRDRPGLLLLDVRLPGVCGYEVCHQLREEFGQAFPIVFVSGDRTEPLDRVAGLLLGADDYLAQPFAPEELLARVQRLFYRGIPLAPGVTSRLTAREIQVLRLLADGLEQSEIARQLVISRRTVGTHIEHILRKLGVRSRTQAVALAYREDLLAASN